MKLQKATQFAILAALALARDPSRQLSVAEIAETYGISAHHLAKVLRDLGRAGLVEAVRGARGGYRFCGNPKRISLYDIILLFGDSLEGENELPGPAGDTAVGQALGNVLEEVDAIAVATLRAISLATLLKSVPADPTSR